ncbi:MAG: DUF305 domain-containing protein [Proteobacteria bacterium]|nr:DUF305 domain-containing protein [Pseudomonadota bacterium]
MKSETQKHGQMHYVFFAIMLVLSFVAMFGFMYAMVDRFANVYPNINQFYMAGLMVAPMAIFELMLMGSMYPNKAANIAIIAASVVALVLFWVGIRDQAGIGDDQFLKSMIPHHAGAILMCQQAPLQDQEIKKLCGKIISSQQSEIDQMKRIMKRLDK